MNETYGVFPHLTYIILGLLVWLEKNVKIYNEFWRKEYIKA